MPEDKSRFSILLEAIDKISEPSVKMRKELDALRKTAEHIGKVTGFTSVGNALGKVGSAAGNVKKEFKGLLGDVAKLGALGAAGAYVFNEQLLKPAIEIEHVSMQLEQLTGSGDKAKVAMEWIEQFAIDSPHNIKQTSAAFIALRKLGIDPVAGSLLAISDAAITTGMTLEDAAAAFAKGALGAPKALKAFGITVSGGKSGKNQFNLIDTKTKQAWHSEVFASGDRLKAAEQLTRALNINYAGAGLKFDQTFEGAIDNIGDAWEIFRRRVMDAGLFKYLKDNLRMVAERLSAALKTGELQRWADTVGTKMLGAAMRFGEALPDMIDKISAIASKVESVVDYFGGWQNVLAGIATLMAGRFIVSTINMGLQLGILAGELSLTPWGPYILAIGAAATAFGALVLAIKEWQDTSNAAMRATQRFPGSGIYEVPLGPVAGNPMGTASTFAAPLGPVASPLNVSREAQGSAGTVHIQLQSDVPMSIYKVKADGFNPHVGTTSSPGAL